MWLLGWFSGVPASSQWRVQGVLVRLYINATKHNPMGWKIRWWSLDRNRELRLQSFQCHRRTAGGGVTKFRCGWFRCPDRYGTWLMMHVYNMFSRSLKYWVHHRSSSWKVWYIKFGETEVSTLEMTRSLMFYEIW